MLGTFSGLYTSLSGLQTAQLGIDTVSHNISNTNTPGYSRETLAISEATALDVSGSTMVGQVGQGVDVEKIQRQTSGFLNEQYREQNTSLGEANVEQSTLNQVSGIINEPSDTGISHAMDQFWNAWDSLGSNPDQLSARTSVVDSAQTLTDVMNQTAKQLSNLNTSVGNSLSDSVSQVNHLVSQIANVSDQIAKVQQTGNQPNDLMDQRSELLDQLSSLTSFKTSETQVSTGPNKYDQFSLTLTGTPTSGVNAGKATAVTVIDGSKPSGQTQVGTLSLTDANNPSAGVTLSQTVESTDSSGAVTKSQNTYDFSGQGGEIQGYQTSLSDVSNYQSDLDQLAQSLAGTQTSDGTPANPGAMTVTLAGQLDISSQTATNYSNMPVSVPNSTATTLGQYLNTPIGTPLANPTSLPAGSKITVNGLNGLLQLGYSEATPSQGQALFGTSDGKSLTASNINVAISGPQLAAAGRTGSDGAALSGDGTLATLASNVKDAQMSFSSPASSTEKLNGTLSDYLTSAVGQLGLQGQQANNTVTTQQSLVSQLDNERQSVSGVSLDEEATHMVSYQQAYNASAKVLSTINDMLTQLMQNV